MKTFKEYREAKKNKPETMETSFGTHSLPKKKETMETSFGSHSLPKTKSVKEDVAPATPKKVAHPMAYAKHIRTDEEHEHQHTQVAPFHQDKATQDERYAVSDYTDSSTPINSMLHMHNKGHDISTQNKAQYRDTAKHLDSALNGHTTHEDTHVYTGIKYSPAKHFKRVAGKVPISVNVHLPAYTSTSTSVTAARSFSEHTSHPNDERHGVDSESHECRHIIKIHVPKGTHAMSLRDSSCVPEEKEILLHRGHELEIHHQPEKLDNETYLWHAKVVGHKLADLSKPAEE